MLRGSSVTNWGATVVRTTKRPVYDSVSRSFVNVLFCFCFVGKRLKLRLGLSHSRVGGLLITRVGESPLWPHV